MLFKNSQAVRVVAGDVIAASDSTNSNRSGACLSIGACVIGVSIREFLAAASISMSRGRVAIV
jgi:hypothetical protein